MSIIRNSLFAVIERFPHRKAAVGRLFRENGTFQTLCEDYWTCSRALQHWNESASKEAVARRKEYKALLKELEAEIIMNLTHND